MEFIKDPAERTTAITDVILALVAFGGIWYLRRNGSDSNDLLKINIWTSAIGLIGLGAALGAAAHGFVISRAWHNRIWRVLNACLALAVSLFAAGVVYDLWGTATCLKWLPRLVLAGLGFYAATLMHPGMFLIFIVYEGLALVFALCAYMYLAVAGDLSGAAIIAAGILISIAAAAIQAGKAITLTVIWKFDHNGIYHIVQVVGILTLLVGLRLSMH